MSSFVYVSDKSANRRMFNVIITVHLTRAVWNKIKSIFTACGFTDDGIPLKNAAFLYDAAKTFSHYYHDNQILKAETKELVVARVELSRMVLQTLKNAFAIVGIPFLSAM